MNNTIMKVTFVVLVLFLFSGCEQSHNKNIYCFSDTDRLNVVEKIGLVELYNQSEYSEIGSLVTDELHHAVLKKQLFAMSLIKQQDVVWKNLGYNFGSEFTLEQLYAMQNSLNVNAVLIGNITDYQPYPHLSVAMSLKIVDIDDGRTIWAAEQIWDSADKSLELRVKKYIKSQMRSTRSADRDNLTFVSSRDFIRFVCYELAETIGD